MQKLKPISDAKERVCIKVSNLQSHGSVNVDKLITKAEDLAHTYLLTNGKGSHGKLSEPMSPEFVTPRSDLAEKTKIARIRVLSMMVSVRCANLALASAKHFREDPYAVVQVYSLRVSE